MTNPAVTRTNEITYGGFTVGGTSSYWLHDVHIIEQDYDSLALSFVVVVRENTKAALLSSVADLKAAYRKPFGDLLVNLGGEDFVDLSHDDNTGFNAVPAIELIETHRTPLSQAYRCSVAVQLPADLAGKDGRASSSVEITTDLIGVRTLTISATYTALGSNSASAQLASAFSTYVDSLKTAFGGSWVQSSGQPVARDDENKNASTTITLVEVIFDQSLNTRVNATLVLPEYTVTVSRQAGTFLTGSGVFAPAEVAVSFQTGVKASESQNLPAVFEEVVRPYLTRIATDHAGGGGLAPVVVAKSVAFDPTRNAISGSILFRIHFSTTIFATLNVANRYPRLETLVPVLDQNPVARDLHFRPVDTVRVITYAIVTLNDPATPQQVDAFEQEIARSEQDGYRLLDSDWSHSRTTEQLDDESTGLSYLVTNLSALLQRVDVKMRAPYLPRGGP